MSIPLKNKYSAPGLRQHLLLRILGLGVAVGVLLLPSSWFFVNNLGWHHIDQLGKILSESLAEQARQPLLHNDTVSLQVVVNNLSGDTPPLLEAAILDTDEHLQVETSNQRLLATSTPVVYTRPIYIENTIAGYARVTLEANTLLKHYRIVFWAVLVAWVTMTMGSCLVASRFGNDISRRLRKFSSGLPTTGRPDQGDEIEQLGEQIKPLLIKSTGQSADSETAGKSIALSICCENYQRLQAQLTDTNFRKLLREFDDIADSAVVLFDAQRLPGSQHCLHLRFHCDGDEQNTLLRAINCCQAINTLVREPATNQGVGLSLTAALRSCETPQNQPSLLGDQYQESVLATLVKTTELADPWQLLIQTSLVEALSQSTAIACEALPNNDDHVLLKSLGSQQQNLLNGQLSYLRSQLPAASGVANAAAF